jgi:hypothetical protein
MVICDHHGDGAPIAGWFVNVYQDNSIQMDDNSGYPHFRKSPSIHIISQYLLVKAPAFCPMIAGDITIYRPGNQPLTAGPL